MTTNPNQSVERVQELLNEHGCFLSPKAEIAFITGQIEADRASALRTAAE